VEEGTDTKNLGSHHREAPHLQARVPDQGELPTGGHVVEVEVFIADQEDA
jgi:hypothetical protein